MHQRPIYRVMAAGVMVTVLGMLSPGRAQIDPAQLTLTSSVILEALLIQAALVGAYVTGAKGQPAVLKQVRQAVAQGAEATFSIDLRKLQLTDQGLQGSK